MGVATGSTHTLVITVCNRLRQHSLPSVAASRGRDPGEDWVNGRDMRGCAREYWCCSSMQTREKTGANGSFLFFSFTDHDEIVLYDEGSLLGMQDKPLDHFCGDEPVDVEPVEPLRIKPARLGALF